MARMKGTRSLSAEAYVRLRQDLVEGTLTPGAKLIIADLQERYEIGAMPLREALNRLSAEQFVLKHEQRGFSVPPLDPDVFLEMQNARIVIECAALRETIATHSREWEDRLVVAFHHLTKAARTGPDYLLSAEWSESHQTFHRELISECKNAWLLNFASQLYTQSARYRGRRRQLRAETDDDGTELLHEHKDIMDASLAGDADVATARLVEHYRHSVESVLGAPVELCPTHARFQRVETAQADE